MLAVGRLWPSSEDGDEDEDEGDGDEDEGDDDDLVFQSLPRSQVQWYE